MLTLNPCSCFSFYRNSNVWFFKFPLTCIIFLHFFSSFVKALDYSLNKHLNSTSQSTSTRFKKKFYYHSNDPNSNCLKLFNFFLALNWFHFLFIFTQPFGIKIRFSQKIVLDLAFSKGYTQGGEAYTC